MATRSHAKTLTAKSFNGLASSIAEAVYPSYKPRTPVTGGLALLEDIPFTVELYDRDGSQVFVNAAWETLWEMPRSLCKGYNLLQDKAVQDSPNWNLIQSAFKGKTAGRSRPLFYSPSAHGLPGRDRWVEIIVCPLTKFSPDAEGVLLIQLDVTDHLKGREEISRLETRLTDLESENRRLKSRVEALEKTGPLESLTGLTNEEVEKRIAELSERETQVFHQIAAGLSVKQIAYAMELSVKSVYTYRARLMRKLKVNNDVALARVAGLVGG